MPGVDRHPAVRAAGLLAAAVLVAASAPAAAQAAERPGGPPGIRPGAWELGFNATVVSREGEVSSTLAVFSNRYWVLRRGDVEIPLSAGAVVAYSRVGDLDRVDMEGLLAAYKRLPETSTFVFFGVGGGLRQEWVGSFSQARYPLGVDTGVKAMLSHRAAITVAYQYRRFLNDPVSDFSEHRFVTGISIFFRNEKE
jgi:hypothetical protein